jgi:hypothetical protein
MDKRRSEMGNRPDGDSGHGGDVDGTTVTAPNGGADDPALTLMVVHAAAGREA